MPKYSIYIKNNLIICQQKNLPLQQPINTGNKNVKKKMNALL